MRSVPWIFLLIAMLLSASAANAQSDDASNAARRALISDAQQASISGDHHHALELALRAAQVRMSASLRRFIAEEQSALGEYVAALASALSCAEEAERDQSLRDRENHRAACQQLAAIARSRVGQLIVAVAHPPEGVTVTVGGTPVPAGVWGVPYAVTPGTIEIEANAPHFVPFHTSVNAPVGDVVTVSIALEIDPTASASPSPEPSSSSPPFPVAVSTALASSSRPSLPVGPLVIAGVGVLGFLATAVLFFRYRQPALDQYHVVVDDRMHCGADGGCDLYARGIWNTLNDFNIATNVVGIAASAVFAIGAAWFVVDRVISRPHNSTLGFAPTRGGAMLQFGVEF